MPDVSLFRRKAPVLTLERVLTDPAYFGLATASPLQRACCRVLDGLPLGTLANDTSVIQAFGGDEALQLLPGQRPNEFVLLAGIRCGKSLIAAAGAVRSALSCDVSRLTAGDVPRVSILSLSLDTARATWNHIRGHVEASQLLRSKLVGDPTSDTMCLRHPSGRTIEIKIVAGSRAAGSLVARWSAGNIFDEAPRMVGAEDGVVNLDEARQATAGRLLPGAQNFYIGSPWAPFGPIFKMVDEHMGKPSRSIVVCRAPAYSMNPEWWTPERCEELRTSNPDAYQVDVLCNFMDPMAGLFTLAELQAVTRQLPLELPPHPRHSYAAAIDPGARGNAFALVVTTNLGPIEGKQRYSVVLARQWIGSKTEPLDMREILRQIADLLRPYRVSSVVTDQWSIDAMRPLASDAGLGLIERRLTGPEKFELYNALKIRVVDGTIELAPNLALIRDLASVRKVVHQNSLSIDLPVGADGRHADFAEATVRALARSVAMPAPEAPNPEEAARLELERDREATRRAVRQRLAAGFRAHR